LPVYLARWEYFEAGESAGMSVVLTRNTQGLFTLKYSLPA
jgi:hypothetical protein